MIRKNIPDGLLADFEIEAIIDQEPDPKKKMISPFVRANKQKGVISYGLTSYGYDMRLANKFKLFSNTLSQATVDPKKFSDTVCVDIEADYLILPPNSFTLACSVEHFNIPTNVLGICLGKSTYARCGLVANITPLEPGWSGVLTIELSNTTSLPIKLYANEGICQLLLFKSRECAVSYLGKNGKYMNTVTVEPARIKK